MKTVSFSSDLFLLESIQENKNANLLRLFRAPNDASGITKFFKKDAKKLEQSGKTRTYLIKLNKKEKDMQSVITAFTISIGYIPYFSESSKTAGTRVIPAIHLDYIAHNEPILKLLKPQLKDLSIGKYVYTYLIEPFFYFICNQIGNIDTVYLYAVNKVVKDIYETWGFKELKNLDDLSSINKTIQTNVEKNCIFMYKRLAPEKLNPIFN